MNRLQRASRRCGRPLNSAELARKHALFSHPTSGAFTPPAYRVLAITLQDLVQCQFPLTGNQTQQKLGVIFRR
jgi:hypothetical protein